MEAQRRQRSFQFKKRERRSGQGRFLGLIKLVSGLMAVAILLYSLLFTNLFVIEKIEIKSEHELLEEQALLNEYLSEYLGKRLVLFNVSTHEEALSEALPHLKTLRLLRRLPNRLVVALEEHPSIANLQMPQEDGSTRFVIVNDQGAIATLDATDENLPTIVLDLEGTEQALEANALIVGQEILTQLVEVSESFEARFKLQVLETHYIKRAREVHLYTERGFYVWLDLTEDVDLQLSKLKKALTKLDIYGQDLEYVDLRISGQNGEKVIYK